MTRLLVASHNVKKRDEIKVLLKEFKDLKIIYFDDLDGPVPMIVEDGKTFRENAVKKAVIVSKFFDDLVLADDSGLEVDALFGKPGVRSARFARKNATDTENNEKLLNLLLKVNEESRAARFVCHVALAKGGKLLEDFGGEVKGTIGSAPRGRKGFGYDPLFIPEKNTKTFGEMPAASKNKISHRARALMKVKKVIGKYVKG